MKGTEKLQPLMMVDGNFTNTLPEEKPDRVLLIISGPASIGEIAIWKGLIPLPAEDDIMFQTFLNQTAEAIDRAQNGYGKTIQSSHS